MLKEFIKKESEIVLSKKNKLMLKRIYKKRFKNCFKQKEYLIDEMIKINLKSNQLTSIALFFSTKTPRYASNADTRNASKDGPNTIEFIFTVK